MGFSFSLPTLNVWINTSQNINFKYMYKLQKCKLQKYRCQKYRFQIYRFQIYRWRLCVIRKQDPRELSCAGRKLWGWVWKRTVSMGNSFTLAQMCANHSILPWMDLKPNCGSQKVKMPQKLPFGENIPSYNFPLSYYTGVGLENSGWLCWCPVWRGQAQARGSLSEWELDVTFLPQTLAIRFATIDNAEAFKAAFLEARQYVLENQVGWAH